MFTLIVENETHEQLELTHSERYDVIKIEGLNPPTAAINTVKIAGVDGSRFNSSQLEARNLVITLNIKPPIETNRLNLYKYFKVKRNCKIYFKNENRDVYIEGYVEAFENDQFSQTQQPQISIVCPEPFWKSLDEMLISFSNTIALFEFPFSIPKEGIEFSKIERITTKTINTGDVKCGGIITFAATSDQILNPVFYNRTNQTYFGLNVDMNDGDKIVVNTNQGQKSVKLIQDGVESNIISKRMSGSTWIVFEPGENIVSYGANEGQSNLNVTVSLIKQYEGV